MSELTNLDKFIEALSKTTLVECNDLSNNLSDQYEFLGKGAIRKDDKVQQLFTNKEDYNTKFINLLDELKFTFNSIKIRNDYFIDYTGDSNYRLPYGADLGSFEAREEAVKRIKVKRKEAPIPEAERLEETIPEAPPPSAPLLPEADRLEEVQKKKINTQLQEIFSKIFKFKLPKNNSLIKYLLILSDILKKHNISDDQLNNIDTFVITFDFKFNTPEKIKELITYIDTNIKINDYHSNLRDLKDDDINNFLETLQGINNAFSTMAGGSIINSPSDLSKFDCASLTSVQYKQYVNIYFAAALLDLFGVKQTTDDGFKMINCKSISPSFNENMKTLLNNLAKIINSHPDVLNTKNKYFNTVNGNWSDTCFGTGKTYNDDVLKKSGLRPFYISNVVKDDKNWNTVQKNIKMSNYYPIMPATQIQSWGRPLGMFGGDGTAATSTVPVSTTDIPIKTAPKLSNDVSRILRTLLDNLKSNNVELASKDIEDINTKLNTFEAMEKDLLKYSLIISTYNRVVGDNGSAGIKSSTELQNITRQYEQKIKSYSKMQNGFEKVIFSILQNC
jgi:hypothetical protein